MDLYTTGGTFLGGGPVIAEVKAPTFGTSPWDEYARSGSQPFIESFDH
jgi:hypothetical protein